MKKHLLILMISLLLVACGTNENAGEQNNPSNEETNGQADAIDVDKNLLSVEVTIPASLVESGDESENLGDMVKAAKKDGVEEVVENDDGSLTYKMSKSTHKDMMKEMKSEMEGTIDGIINDEEYTSIHDITTNESFTEFDVLVDKEKFEDSFDGLSVFSLVFGSMFYQLFDGVTADDYEAVFNFEDKNSGEVFETTVYPDAFEE